MRHSSSLARTKLQACSSPDRNSVQLQNFGPWSCNQTGSSLLHVYQSCHGSLSGLEKGLATRLKWFKARYLFLILRTESYIGRNRMVEMYLSPKLGKMTCKPTWLVNCLNHGKMSKMKLTCSHRNQLSGIFRSFANIDSSNRCSTRGNTNLHTNP